MATTPITSDPQDFSEAIDRLSQVASGNVHINTHPGLMTALAGGSATPQQAQMLDQYMAGVKAQNIYQLAKASGGPLNFTTEEQRAMGAMGFDYSAVDAKAVPQTGQGVAGAGSSSSLAPAPLAATQPRPEHHNGFFDKGILHAASRVGYDALHNPVTNAMGQGLNVVQSAGAGVVSDIQSVEQHLGLTQDSTAADALDFLGLQGKASGLLLPEKNGKYGGALDAQRKEQMKALGYDPDSIWSGLAFDAHGYAKSDITPALEKWDAAGGEQKFGWSADEAMTRALQFSKDPKAARDAIINDTALTPEEAAQKLTALNSPEFIALSQRLHAADATIGHATATAAGIDPVEHPLEFNLTAAATDVVASFYIDPTMNLGRVVNAVRKVPLAIEGLNDTERMASLLDPAQAGLNPARHRVINGWQSMIDSTNEIRTALEAGDHATAAAAYASIQAKTPTLLDLVPDFIGKSQGAFRTAADQAGIGVKSDVLKLVEGEPITNLAEAARFVTQRGGNARLMSGKASVESSYMPGAVSNWGFKALKANRAAHAAYTASVRDAADSAAWIEARNAGKLTEQDSSVVQSAWKKADPGEATHATVDIKNIRRLLPTSEDGIAIESGAIVASPDASLIGRHVADTLVAEKAVNTLSAHAAATAKDAELAGVLGTDAERAMTAAESATAQARHEAALQELRSKKDELASALRAAREGGSADSAATWGDQLLPAEAGKIAFNRRRYGSAVASDGPAIGGWASPSAIAARGRLAMARWSNLLPIDNTFDLTAQSSAMKVGQFAKYYLGKGQANQLAAQFAGGDLGTRKAIVHGLWDQVAHAGGLSRTDTGRELMKSTQATHEAYTHVGPGWVIDGQQVALHKAQTAPSISLPSFKQIHDVAAKVGLYESTVGRVATATAADNIFNVFRISLLIRPATATRNAIEPYLKAITDGQFGSVLRARALTYSSSDELARMGEKLGVKELTGEVPPELITMAQRNLSEKIAAGASKHEIAVAQHTVTRVRAGDISAMAGFGRTRLGSAFADHLAHITQFYHTQLLKAMPEAELKYVQELYEVLPQMLHNFGQMTVAEAFSPLGATSIRDAAESGLLAGRAEVNLAGGAHPLLTVPKSEGGGKFKRTGFGLETTDHSIGLQRYINALHQRTHGSPETAKAAVAAARGEIAPQGGVPLKRFSANAAEDIHNPPSQGTHFSIDRPGESNIFESGFASGKKTRYQAKGVGGPGVLKPTAVEHDAAGGYASASISALKHLTSATEFKRIMKLDGPELKAELTRKFPHEDLSGIHELAGTQLREAYGAILARSKGYHAISVKDAQTPEYDEYLALTSGAFVRDVDPLSSVIKALDSETQKATAYGHYYKPDDTGNAVRAITPDEVALGKRQWAQDVVNDYRYMLKGQDGELNTKVADYIAETGTAPDALWFGGNLAKGDLPAHVLAPVYEPMPIGGPTVIAQTLQDVSGKAFNRIVEGTIKRQSSSPVMAAHYLKARVESEGMLELLTADGGISEEAAQAVLKGQAIRSAYVRSAQMLDDPGQKTQFDVVARNLLMFPRAMEAFIRRWGGSLAADPFKARKMMLALEGTEHSGLIYRDERGQPTFTYPGSQVMRDAMVGLSKVPGFGNFVHFPLGMDMSGKVMQMTPGFQNPLRFSLSPMVNIPMREVFSLMPEHQSVWTEIDTALNGSIGASQAKQGPLASLLPSTFKNLMAAHNEDERNGIFASAMVGAIAHLDAAGLTPGPYATPSEIETYKNQVKAQVRNQLYMRFAFGLVAPAAPSSLNENIDNADAKNGGTGTAADYAFSVSGIRNMSAEYKSIVDATGGDVARAAQIFTALHPEGIAYTVSSSGATANKAYLPATRSSLSWMEGNIDFLNKYKSVGAYFMPKEQGDFDSNAYNAQMAMGLRQKKTLSEFYNDVQVARGDQEYYLRLDQYTAAHDAALTSGDHQRAKVLSAGFSDWKAEYLDKNPPLKAKFVSSVTNADVAQRQIDDLTKMVSDGDAPPDLTAKLDEMLKIFKAAGTWKSQQPDTVLAAAQKQAVSMGVDEKLGSIAASDPRLTNIYNAVFRSVDRNLTKVG